MDHKALIASLSTDQRAELCRRSDRAGLLQAVLHLGLTVSFATYIALGLPYWAIALIPLGILLNFLFTALHETIHRTAFASQALNDWMARLAGFMVILPPDYFRYFHFAHHRHTHDPERDPELEGGKPDTVWKLVVYLTGLPEFIDRPKVVLMNAIRTNSADWIPSAGKDKVMREAQVFLCCYAAMALASIVAESSLLLWIWIAPLVIGGPFLRAYLLAEHGLCPHVSNMFENTRTTFTNRVVRFLAWNMPFHAEHHAYPAVPFHKLPAFHTLAQRYLAETEQGYPRFTTRYFRDPKAPHNTSQAG